MWLCLQIQSYQCIISIELFLNSLSYFVVLFLSQTLQGLQTLKQHYFFKNAHCMINGQKKDSNQVYCICFFSFFQLCPKLYTTYSQAISVGFPLHLDPSSKSSIMRKWTEWLNCCKLEIVQFGKWQKKVKITQATIYSVFVGSWHLSFKIPRFQEVPCEQVESPAKTALISYTMDSVVEFLWLIGHLLWTSSFSKVWK